MTVGRKDRRGRGIRGPLYPPTLPVYRTRSEKFNTLVLDAVESLSTSWAEALGDTEFGTELIPPSNPAPWETRGAILGRCFPAESGLPARIVLYRRPIEARVGDDAELAVLILSVVVEQVAHLLARTPEEIDPRFEP